MTSTGPWYLIPYINQDAVLGCAGGGTTEGTPIVLASKDGTPNQSWQLNYLTFWGANSYSFNPYSAMNMALDTNNGYGNTCWLWTYDSSNYNQNFFATSIPNQTGGWVWLQRNYDGAYLTATGSDYNSTLTVTDNNDGYPYNQWWKSDNAPSADGTIKVMTPEEKAAFMAKLAPPEAVKQRWARMREERERARRPKIADKPASSGQAVASIEMLEEVQKDGDHAVAAVSTSRRRCFHCLGALLLALLSAGLFLLGLIFGARWGK